MSILITLKTGQMIITSHISFGFDKTGEFCAFISRKDDMLSVPVNQITLIQEN